MPRGMHDVFNRHDVGRSQRLYGLRRRLQAERNAMRAEKLFGNGLCDVLRRQSKRRSGEQVGIGRRVLQLCAEKLFRTGIFDVLRGGIFIQSGGSFRFGRRMRDLFADFGILHVQQPVRRQSEMRQQQLYRRCMPRLPDSRQPYLRCGVGMLHVQQPMRREPKMRQQRLCRKILRRNQQRL